LVRVGDRPTPRSIVQRLAGRSIRIPGPELVMGRHCWMGVVPVEVEAWPELPKSWPPMMVGDHQVQRRSRCTTVKRGGRRCRSPLPWRPASGVEIVDRLQRPAVGRNGRLGDVGSIAGRWLQSSARELVRSGRPNPGRSSGARRSDSIQAKMVIADTADWRLVAVELRRAGIAQRGPRGLVGAVQNVSYRARNRR